MYSRLWWITCYNNNCQNKSQLLHWHCSSQLTGFNPFLYLSLRIIDQPSVRGRITKFLLTGNRTESEDSLPFTAVSSLMEDNSSTDFGFGFDAAMSESRTCDSVINHLYLIFLFHLRIIYKDSMVYPLMDPHMFTLHQSNGSWCLWLFIVKLCVHFMSMCLKDLKNGHWLTLESFFTCPPPNYVRLHWKVYPK